MVVSPGDSNIRGERVELDRWNGHVGFGIARWKRNVAAKDNCQGTGKRHRWEAVTPTEHRCQGCGVYGGGKYAGRIKPKGCMFPTGHPTRKRCKKPAKYLITHDDHTTKVGVCEAHRLGWPSKVERDAAGRAKTAGCRLASE